MALLLGCCLTAHAQTSIAETNRADLQAFFKEIDATYPFFDLKKIRADWEAAKTELLAKAETCADDAAFIGLLNDAVRAINDSHMYVADPVVPAPPVPPQYYPGISFMPASEGRVVVMSVREELKETLPVGTVILSVDDTPVRAFFESAAKAAWPRSGNSSRQRVRIFTYRMPMRGEQGAKHTLTYLDAGGAAQRIEVVCDVEARGWPHGYNFPEDCESAGESVRFRVLDSRMGYIYLRRVDADCAKSLHQARRAMHHTLGTIVDLRGNGGGGYDDALLKELEKLHKPVVVILDAGCISAGETLARDIQRLAGAVLIGERTAGASSSKRRYALPSGRASVQVSTRSRGRNDGAPIEYNGIAPDIFIEPEPAEVRTGINSEIAAAETLILSGYVSLTDVHGVYRLASGFHARPNRGYYTHDTFYQDALWTQNRWWSSTTLISPMARNPFCAMSRCVSIRENS